MEPFRDFISKDPRSFRFKIGRVLASSLSGFIAGVVFASLVFIGGYILVRYLSSI